MKTGEVVFSKRSLSDITYPAFSDTLQLFGPHGGKTISFRNSRPVRPNSESVPISGFRIDGTKNLTMNDRGLSDQHATRRPLKRQGMEYRSFRLDRFLNNPSFILFKFLIFSRKNLFRDGFLKWFSSHQKFRALKSPHALNSPSILLLPIPTFVQVQNFGFEEQKDVMHTQKSNISGRSRRGKWERLGWKRELWPNFCTLLNSAGTFLEVTSSF